MSATNPSGQASDRAKRAAPRAGVLPPALDADRREVTQRAGRLSYYVAGRGAPLLLVHSINAAPSAFEVRPVFEAMRGTHRVFAVDLPGFGFSDRSARDYSVPLFVAAIRDMLDVIAADCGAQPVDALALSLGSEFLARAASQVPGRFRTLSLVGPTGFSDRTPQLDAPAGSTREAPGMQRLLRFPLWGGALYNLLVSRPSIRYFLQRTWGSKNIDEGVFEYAYLTSHQPGASNAPFAFLAGRLFSRDSLRLYESLALPVWVSRGTRGDFQAMPQLARIEGKPNWRVQTFDSGAMPHFEQQVAFMASFKQFLADPAPGGAR